MKGNHLIETRLIGSAGLSGAGTIGRTTGCLDELSTLPERIRQILNIIYSAERKPGNMICFIMYDNNDSILIVPLSEDYARAMKIIGQEVDVDLILHSKNTLFF